ncbi:MAG: PQQ-binding-like beta-propeller repeat protein [Pseudomonadota bacterium]|nr:PQQ-binding-like beta-propeller repeat protein [Pseudomonadota bacterium]
MAGISPDVLNDLAVKWVFAVADTDAPHTQPLITSNTVVIGDGSGGVYALDRDTGCERWRFDAGSMVRTALRYIQTDSHHLISFGTLEAEVFAVDLMTGVQRWRVKVGEHPQAMVTGSSVDHKGIIYQPISSWEVFWALNPFYSCCDFRSSIVAIDALTGEILWRSYTIDEPAKVTKPRLIFGDRRGPSGAPVWSQPALDVKRNRLYVGTGENYSAPVTDTSDAIMAFDLTTGERIWSQQFLAGDAWTAACASPLDANCPEEDGPDLDFGAPPILVTLDNKDYILAGQKSGDVYALDPDNNGQTLWAYKASNGGMAGGVHFGMAIDQTRGALYVPISDRDVGIIGENPPGTPKPSLHAIDIASGSPLWTVPAPGDCLDPKNNKPIKNCHVGLSAAVTVTEDIVFAPSLDGNLYAFSSKNGELLWSYDTVRDFEAVNELEASGGAIDLGGVYLDGGQLFVSSGYGQMGQLPGNAFIVMDVQVEEQP